jgi:hypothetical protein
LTFSNYAYNEIMTKEEKILFLKQLEERKEQENRLIES